MTENKWVTSFTGEEYDYEEFDTKIQAIQYLKEENYNECRYAYIGQVELYHPQIDVDKVIEQLSEDSYNDSPEWGGGYLIDCPQEQIDDLENMLNVVLKEWIDKWNNYPKHFTVKNVETVCLESEEK